MEIDIMRLEICNNYKAKQGMEITPKEYILMLIDFYWE
jgi:hypothetical protein